MWLWEDGKELDIDSAAILLELGLLRDTDLGSQMPCYYTKVNEKKMWHTTFDINSKQMWKMFLEALLRFINIKAHLTAHTDPVMIVLNTAVTDAGVFSGRSARIASTDLSRSGCRLQFGSRHELIGTVNQSCPLRDLNIWCHKHTCHCALLENTALSSGLPGLRDKTSPMAISINHRLGDPAYLFKLNHVTQFSVHWQLNKHT